MLLRVETREMFLKISSFDFCFHSSGEEVNNVITAKDWNNKRKVIFEIDLHRISP
jgi:hypothetical protein